jgi:hypothetical protein
MSVGWAGPPAHAFNGHLNSRVRAAPAYEDFLTRRYHSHSSRTCLAV